MRIQQKLAVVYIVTITIPILFISYVFFSQVQQLIFTHMTESYEGVLKQQNDAIKSNLKLYQSIADSLLLDSTIQAILGDSEGIEALSVHDIHEKFGESMGAVATYLISDINSIEFYSANEKVKSDGNYLFSSARLLRSADFKKGLPTSAYWYLEYDERKKSHYITLLKPITSAKTYRKIGYIKLSVQPSSIFETEEETGRDKSGNDIYTVDGNGTIVLRGNGVGLGTSAPAAVMDAIRFDSSSQDRKLRTISLDGNRYHIGTKKLDSLGWTSVVLVPLESLKGKISGIRELIIVVSIGCALLFALMSFIITRRITLGLRSLHRKVSLVRKGQMNIAPSARKTNDEVGELDRNFDYMLENLKKLINENYVEKLNKREIELKFLQAQINPHFLYNTLDSIRNQIDLGENESAVKMTVALADLFRISVSKGRDLISWEEELHHARCYAEIIFIRFGDRFSFEWDIDPAITRLMTLKIILQPLLENAVSHGFQIGKKKGTIRITAAAEPDGKLRIAIRDDGNGIPPDQLASIRAGKAGVGIANVQNRIKTFFGEEYGLFVDSEPGRGTEVMLVLPVLTGEEGGEHVPGTDRGR